MEDRINRVLEDRIEFGYDFPVSDYLREGWNLYKKFAGGFIGFFLLTLLINFVAGLIPVLGFLVTTFILSPALTAGNYLVADKIQRGERFSFNDFFRGFDFIGPLALMSMIMILILAAVFTPSVFALSSSGFFEWYAGLLENPFDPQAPSPPEVSSRTLAILALNALPLVYLSIAYLWAPLFVVFYQAGAWEALESSRRLISRRWFAVFGLMLTVTGIFLAFYLPAILTMLLSPVLGVVILFFLMMAVFLVIPAFFCVLYVSFADVTRLYETGGDRLEDHLIE